MINIILFIEHKLELLVEIKVFGLNWINTIFATIREDEKVPNYDLTFE